MCYPYNGIFITIYHFYVFLYLLVEKDIHPKFSGKKKKGLWNSIALYYPLYDYNVYIMYLYVKKLLKGYSPNITSADIWVILNFFPYFTMYMYSFYSQKKQRYFYFRDTMAIDFRNFTYCNLFKNISIYISLELMPSL